MRRSSVALFHQLRELVPTKKTSDLLKEGGRALQKNDFEGAINAYKRIPEDEKTCKPVQGFFARIDNVKKTHSYTQKLAEETNKKSR